MVGFISGRNLPVESSFILAYYFLFLIEQSKEKKFLLPDDLLN